MTPISVSSCFATVVATGVISILGISQALADMEALRTVNAFTPGTAITRTFDRFIEEIRSDPDAPIKIEFIGGPETMPPFQVGNAVGSGVVDMALVTSAFYTSSLPSAQALILSRFTPKELRATGRFEKIQEMWREQLNVHYLAYTNYGNRFHLYLNEPISTPDLSGMRIRTTPMYRAFIEAMGGEAARTPPGEVYTALERGSVDGYGWPIQGIFDLGWQEHTQYRVDPGFYNAEVGVLVNQKKWDSLTDTQRDYLTDKAVWLESLNEDNYEINEEEEKKQAEAGIEVIEFDDEMKARYLNIAYESLWERLAEEHPANTQRLKEILDNDD